jgi:hypothetical protein
MKDTLTHWKKFHNPDYIGAYAFEPGQEIIATIKAAGIEQVIGTAGKKEDCMVVRFVESDLKPLICNVTNAKSITKAIGSPYIENWANQKIQLYTTTVLAFGEEVEAVRVRPKQPKASKPKLTETHAKWSDIVAKLASNDTTIETVRQHFDVSDEIANKLMTDAMEVA